MQPVTEKKENPIQWLWRYVSESREELGKVTWSNRQETTKYSVIILILCLALAAFFAGIDWIFNQGLEWLILIAAGA